MEEEENTAKRLALSENDKEDRSNRSSNWRRNRNSRVTTKATAKAGIDSNDASAAASGSSKNRNCRRRSQRSGLGAIHQRSRRRRGYSNRPCSSRGYSRSAHKVQT